MNLLLDSHAYLWWLTGDNRLRTSAREAIDDPSRTIFVSAATIWELAIKSKLGKLDVGVLNLADEIGLCGFFPLPITPEDAQVAASFPRHHDDPFDRMLVAQCQVHALALVSRDSRLDAYPVSILLA